MSTPSKLQNPIVRLAELFVDGEALRSTRIQLLNEMYNNTVKDLPPEELRRLLTSQDDALLLLLTKLQLGGSGFAAACHTLGWRILCTALSLWEDVQIPRDKRLLCKLLLRHSDLLGSAASNLFCLFSIACTGQLHPEAQPSAKSIQELGHLTSLLADVLFTFVVLLTQTHRPEHAQHMACMLGNLHDVYRLAASQIRPGSTASVRGGNGLVTWLHKVMRLMPVLMERVVSPLPVGCVDTETARSIIRGALFATVLPSPAARVSEEHVRNLCSPYLSQRFTYNIAFVHSMLPQADQVGGDCELLCV